MKQHIPGSSLNAVKAAKSTLFKNVFLSLSVLALSSTSAIAAQESQADLDGQQLKLVHVPGYGDYIKSAGDKAGAIYSTITPVEGTGWIAATSFDDAYTYKCSPSGKDACQVDVVGAGMTNVNSDPDPKLLWDLNIRHATNTVKSIEAMLTGDLLDPWKSRYDHAVRQLAKLRAECREALPGSSVCESK